MNQSIGKVVHSKEVRLSLEVDQQVHHLLELARKVGDGHFLLMGHAQQVVMMMSESKKVVL